MITFDELLKKAIDKGYRPLFPDFGDGRPTHTSLDIQRVELRYITDWVITNFKLMLQKELDESIKSLSFIIAIKKLSEKIDELPYCPPADKK